MAAKCETGGPEGHVLTFAAVFVGGIGRLRVPVERAAEAETMAAPIVVAKGAGVIAERIRKLALQHNIPILEKKPLAQALYREVDVNRPIPQDKYAAVAEVLAYVYQLKGRRIGPHAGKT
jgi:type III secretion system FlhB-like substrate exporter